MKKKRQEPVWDLDQDENFAFIAGYTPGGFPYGITWEEQAEIDRREREGRLPVEDCSPDFSSEKERDQVGDQAEDYTGSFDSVDIADLPF